MASDSANANWTNTVWEFHKSNLRIRVNANAPGVIQRNITPATYQSVFGLGTSPLGNSGTVRAILFDFDQISGNATFTSNAGQLRAIVQSPGGGTAPVIDAAARLGSEEEATLMGMMHESGLVHRNNQINAFSTVLVRTVLSAPDNAGSTALFTPLGAGTVNYAIYEGTLIPPATGNYRFRVRTDDGSRLWVNDVNRISTWVAQAPATHTSGDFSLTANVPVPIWYEWWEGGGQEARQLQWQVPGSNTYVTIPDTSLRPGNGTEPVERGFWGFNDGVSAGWSFNGIRVAANGNGPLGVPNANGIVQNQFLGDFGGENAEPSLSLGDVPAGRIIVTYEVQLIGTWETNHSDGQSGQTGPDHLHLRANGSTLFSQVAAQTTTGELSTTLPFASVLRDGNWRRYRCEFNHGGGSLTLSWQKTSPGTIDSINDESFVLDNVMVRRKR